MAADLDLNKFDFRCFNDNNHDHSFKNTEEDNFDDDDDDHDDDDDDDDNGVFFPPDCSYKVEGLSIELINPQVGSIQLIFAAPVPQVYIVMATI